MKTLSQTSEARELRLRRLAARHGLTLTKQRRFIVEEGVVMRYVISDGSNFMRGWYANVDALEEDSKTWKEQQ
jgi:2-hydroxychromene-2-carboxylate isomerase